MVASGMGRWLATCGWRMVSSEFHVVAIGDSGQQPPAHHVRYEAHGTKHDDSKKHKVRLRKPSRVEDQVADARLRRDVDTAVPNCSPSSRVHKCTCRSRYAIMKATLTPCRSGAMAHIRRRGGWRSCRRVRGAPPRSRDRRSDCRARVDRRRDHIVRRPR